MSEFLQEAAALLRKAAETNERNNQGVSSVLNGNRERIAMEFAVLAAIDKGLLTQSALDHLPDLAAAL